jgi:hypothetical protein
MMQFDLNQEPRRLEEINVAELEAAIQRGRTLQARAMGLGLKALFRAVVFGEEPPAARDPQGELDWEQVLGLDPHQPAQGAIR